MVVVVVVVLGVLGDSRGLPFPANEEQFNLTTTPLPLSNLCTRQWIRIIVHFSYWYPTAQAVNINKHGCLFSCSFLVITALILYAFVQKKTKKKTHDNYFIRVFLKLSIC